jgi:ribosomal protein S14
MRLANPCHRCGGRIGVVRNPSNRNRLLGLFLDATIVGRPFGTGPRRAQITCRRCGTHLGVTTPRAPHRRYR